MLVCPELASSANTSLDLINNHEDLVLPGDLSEALEESWAGMVVTTLRLNWFDDDGSWRVVVVLDKLLGLCEASGFLACVLLDVVLERVLERWEGSLWPVESGNVQLVNWL